MRFKSVDLAQAWSTAHGKLIHVEVEGAAGVLQVYPGGRKVFLGADKGKVYERWRKRLTPDAEFYSCTCNYCHPAPVDADDCDVEFDDDDEFEFDCHMDRNGQCGAAGSEDCEFECPVMADIRRQERKKAGRSR